MRLNRASALVMGTAFMMLTVNTFWGAETAGDACALLPQARVSAVLGVSVGAGEHIASPLVCGWAQPNDTNHTGKRVVLTLYGPIGKLTPVDRFNNGKSPVQGIPKTPVSGIGDDAYYVTTPGLGTGLDVKKANSVFQIRVYGFPEDQIKAMEKTLAQDALTKL